MPFPPHISSNKYGWYMEEPGVNNYVECQNCLVRIIGGSEVSRLHRFFVHTFLTGHHAGGRAVESQQI